MTSSSRKLAAAVSGFEGYTRHVLRIRRYILVMSPASSKPTISSFHAPTRRDQACRCLLFFEGPRYVCFLSTPPIPPKGCICLNGVEEQLVSEDGMAKFNELMEFADKCNPDVQACYAYNDFYPYALFSIIEESMDELAEVIKDKKRGASHKDAITLLEAVVMFMATEDQYVMSDDAEALKCIVRVLGAACHTVASAMAKAGLLTTDKNPHASNLFLTAISLIDDLQTMCGPTTKAGICITVMLCRAGLPYAKKKRTIMHPPKPVRSAASDADGEDEEDSDEGEEADEPEDPEPPKKRGRFSKNETDPVKLSAMSYEEAEKQLRVNKALCSYAFTNVWGIYKGSYFRPGHLHDEFRFGQGFDITEWPEELRKRVSFDNIDV